jgi:hypothetical protein
MRYGHLVMSLFCAWVLWGTPFDKTTGSNIGAPTALNGYESRTECMETFVAVAAKPDTKLDRTWQYACLPDTIDPRAPKAGK